MRCRHVHVAMRPEPALPLILDLLADVGWHVTTHQSAETLWTLTEDDQGPVALIDWSLMQGLLSGEHRQDLAFLNQKLPLVVLVPNRWRRLVSSSDLGVAAVVSRPFEGGMLLGALNAALEASPATTAQCQLHAFLVTEQAGPMTAPLFAR